MSNEVMTTVSLAGGPKATLVFNVSTACLMSLVSIIMVAVMHLRRHSKYHAIFRFFSRNYST